MRAALRSVVGSRFGLRVVGIFVLAALVPLGLASALLLSEFGSLLAQRDQKDIDGLVRGYGMGLIGRLASANDVLQGLTAGADAAAAQRRIAALDEMEWVRDVRHRAAGETTRPTSRRTSVLTNRDADGVVRVSLLRGLADGSALEVELAPGWLWGDLVEFTDEATIEVLDPAGARLSIEGADAARAGESGLRQAIAAASSGKRTAGRDWDGPWAVASWELFLTGQFDSGSWRVVGFKPASSVMGGLYNTRLYFPAIVVLALLLVSLASVRLIRRQLRPLEVLVEGTKKVGRLEFSEPVKVAGDDEFADLAASFNGMTDRLRLQFSALEALAEIDRQLLQSHGLEPILGTVLPRIARVLGCHSLSVLLSDPDAADHGRAYDCLATGDTRVPIRRVVAGVDALRDAAGGSASVEISAADPRFEPFLAPMREAGGQRFLLSALRHDAEVRGFLCAGFKGDPAEPANSSVAIEDFADRLSVVLANLGRAEKLYEQANYDPLTRLANRQHFREELSRRLLRRPGASATGALLYIDLDQFKQINDTAGHTTGDQLLCAVATRLRGCFRPDDLVARLGGDEFAAIIEQTGDGESARLAAQRVLEALHAPLQLGKREYRIEASIGITLFPADGDTIEELLKNSDMAMYRAKESGRGRAVFFESEMQDRMQARAALESGMYRALDREEFRLVYQPIISGEAGVPSGVEALIRWPSAPGGEPISPAVFMPLAEESNLISGVGEWVLRTACQEFEKWKHVGAAVGYVSVNMSSRQLRDPKFIKLVSDCLSASQMSPGELHLEITESVLADGPSIARTLQGLSALGVHLALDDFGTGYSSLSYLRQFPIDSVKIDKSFITEIPESNSACRLVESIIAMTTVLGKHVVAEGVEEELQLAFLRSAGCGSVQGFLFSRPMEPAGIPAFFRRLAAGRIPLAGGAAPHRIAAL